MPYENTKFLYVNRGVLLVDGSINSNASVRGTLAGRGTVHGNVINNNFGTVMPGEASGGPGVLTVVQNYTQAQYARLIIQIAGSSTGDFSVLNVLGTANLSVYLSSSFSTALSRRLVNRLRF